MGAVTILELKALRAGETLTEHLTGRGTGSLLFKGGAAGVTAFFRIRKKSADVLIKIAKYPAVDLIAIRKKAKELSELAATGVDVKKYLADVEVKSRLEAEQRKAELAEIEWQRKIDAARGTLRELFENYIESRRGSIGGRQIEELERVLKKELITDNPSLASKKARDITAEDIFVIISKIYDRGSDGMADKMRSYLHACFEYELKNTFSLKNRNRNGLIKFELLMNPVSLISKDRPAVAKTRALTDGELKQFYHTIDCTDGVSEVMGLLFKLNIFLGGQRILQLAQAPWSHYDFKNNYIKLIDGKGRKKEGSSPKIHLLPLTSSALAIIERLQVISGSSDYPFSLMGHSPFDVSSFAHATKKWLDSKNGKLNGNQIAAFTPRDIRRTCSRIMQKLKVDESLNNKIQSHGVSGVTRTHYLNDPEGSLPEKLSALTKYEKGLKRILK